MPVSLEWCLDTHLLARSENALIWKVLKNAGIASIQKENMWLKLATTCCTNAKAGTEVIGIMNSVSKTMSNMIRNESPTDSNLTMRCERSMTCSYTRKTGMNRLTLMITLWTIWTQEKKYSVPIEIMYIISYASIQRLPLSSGQTWLRKPQRTNKMDLTLRDQSTYGKPWHTAVGDKRLDTNMCLLLKRKQKISTLRIIVWKRRNTLTLIGGTNRSLFQILWRRGSVSGIAIWFVQKYKVTFGADEVLGDMSDGKEEALACKFGWYQKDYCPAVQLTADIPDNGDLPAGEDDWGNKIDEVHR